MRNGKKFAKDNYKGRETKYCKSNIYEIRTPLNKLIGPTYYANAYLIVPTTNKRLEELKRLKAFEIAVNESIADNSSRWHKNIELSEMTNDKTFKTSLTAENKRISKQNDRLRAKLEDIQKEFDKFE